MAVYLGEEVSNMTNSKETPPERSEDQTEVAPDEIQDLEDSVAQELLDPVIDEAASGPLPDIQAEAGKFRDLALRAEAEMQRGLRRYLWMGNRPHWQVMRQLARSQVMVLSSRMEGGANVVGESISVGTPVLSTRISGSIGLLGEDYTGFYEPGDVAGLRRLLLEAEKQSEFYSEISESCAALKSVFEPAHERRAWRELLGELT